MTDHAPLEFTANNPPLTIGTFTPPNTIRFMNSTSEKVAEIGPDGIMRFTVEATDANAAKFVECIERFINMRLAGIKVTDVEPKVTPSSVWSEHALQVAGHCWCDDETKDLVMIPKLAEAFAKRLESLMDYAAQEQRNSDFYRGLLDKVAAELGPVRPKVFVQDDGGIAIDPLRLKIPELVAELAAAATQWFNIKDQLKNFDPSIGEEIIVPVYNVHDGKIVY